MTLNIIYYPDPRLKIKASPVAISAVRSDHIQKILADMLATMYQANGIGLAAIQVNIPLQIITVDLSESKSQPMYVINPKIINAIGSIYYDEGCLSFPGIYTKIKRHKTITIEFFNDKGEPQSIEATNLLSICLQHEIDHLDGKTFFDHISPLRRMLLKKQLKKLRSQTL